MKQIAFYAGVVVLVAFGLSEAAARLGWRLGEHDCQHGFPWGALLVGIILVAPATVGAKYIGPALQKVAGMLPGKRNGEGPGL